MKKILIFAGAALAIGVGYHALFTGTRSDGASISFSGPGAIRYGEPFELAVGISNASDEVWHDAALSLALPRGFVFVEGSNGGSFAAKALGTLGGGSLATEKFIVMAVQNAGTSADASMDADADITLPAPESAAFEASVSYALASGKTIFETHATWSAPSPQPALELSLDAPHSISSGSEMKIVVSYANRSESGLDDIILAFSYPEGFSFDRASADSARDDREWDIGSIGKGSSDSLSIFGRLDDAGTARFAVTAYRMVRGVRRPIARAEAEVEVGKPPLTVEIDANDTPDFVARPGGEVSYTISYISEGAAISRSGVTVTAIPSSPMFNLSSIAPRDGGTVRRGKTGVQEVVWAVSGDTAEGGSVGFSIKLKPEYDIRRLGDRNFTIKLHAEARAGELTGSGDIEHKVAGLMKLETKAYYRDAASLIVNSGPLPPKAGTATQYTVHWKLVNYATDMKDIVVRARFATGTVFAGTSKSSTDTKPEYDRASNEMVWKIRRISATTGVLSPAPEAVFQIAGTPAGDMAGKYMPLMERATLVADDAFSEARIETNASEITTALPDDPTVGASGIVSP